MELEPREVPSAGKRSREAEERRDSIASAIEMHFTLAGKLVSRDSQDGTAVLEVGRGSAVSPNLFFSQSKTIRVFLSGAITVGTVQAFSLQDAIERVERGLARSEKR